MFSALFHGWTRSFLSANSTKILFENFFSYKAALNVNYYDALGISKSSTQSDIKAAYYKLSMQYHPDKNQGCEDAAQKFREISQAYEVLGNYHLRRLYDKGIIHTAGQEYAHHHHSASPSASETVVEEEDDPATKFYKSRLRKSQMSNVSGRTPIYDYDEWSRAHYGYSFQRKKEARSKYDRHEQQRTKDAASKAHEVLLFGMIFAVVVVYAGFYTQTSYDTPRAMAYNTAETRIPKNATKE